MPQKASFIVPGQLHTGVRAATKSRKPSDKRKEAMFKRTKYWKTLEERNWLDEMMEKYDTSDTGNLLFKEVGKMLKDMSGGEEPTDEEVAFVIRSTHRDAKDRNDDLTRSEIPVALDVWHEYEQQKDMIAAIFAKYDLNQSGKLESDQLQKLLTELNDGIEVPQVEVDWVLKAVDGAIEGIDATGGVNQTEIMGAISLWFTHLDEADEESKKDLLAGPPPAPVAGKSGCCVLM